MLLNRSILAAAILSAMMLTACGGGGGGGSNNVKPETPPPPPPTTPPPPPPTCNDDTATNVGGSLPCTYRYNGTQDNPLVGTNADLAHAAGFTGKGAKIGLLDDAKLGDYKPLDGKVTFYHDYTDNPGVPGSLDYEKRGHGTVIAASMVGNAGDSFNGGVAPDAQLYWGRICVDNSCWSDAAGRAVDEMVDAGVRIFNLSLGSYYGTDVEGAKFSSAAWASGMRKAVDAGGLVLAATGNDGEDTSGFPAAAPVYEPSLVNNWLAVTSVDVNTDGTTTTKSSYANACGDAADWCLAAPGSIYTPAVEGTLYTGGAQGTSVSVGVVSSVAALVQGAYPWMDGANLQQTLLTTATDIGENGVDPIFGWGSVNAYKAIHGPGLFVGTDFKANVTGSFAFANDIGGDHGLVKAGDGLLVLTGDNTFTGDTIINAGSLGFAGDTASSVAVNDGGTYTALGGKIGGSYTASEGANTQIALGNPLLIAGTANLDGKLTLTPEANGYTVNSTENLLTAGGIAGYFKETAYGNGLFWTATLNYTGTTLDATMTRVAAAASAQSFGLTAASVDGARQFDSLTGELDKRVTAGSTAGLDSLLSTAAGLMHSDLATAAASLASLTGQIHGIQRTVSVQGAINDARMLADRLPHLASTTATTGWAQATHLDGNLDRDGYASADYRQDMFSVGVDLPMGDAVVGAAISSGSTRANINESRSHLDSDRLGVSAYGYLPFDTAYLSGVVGYDQSKVDTRRDVLAGSAIEQLLSKRDDSAIHARIELGANLGNGLTPFAAVGGIRQTQDAFAEASASGLGLSANKDSLSLGYADVGLRHRQQANGWTFDSMVSYRNVFDGDRTDFDAWFTALPDAGFTINGQSLPQDSLRASFGIGYQVSRNVFAYGNLGLERSSDQHDNATATVGVRWLF